MAPSPELDYSVLFPKFPWPIKILENERLRLEPLQFDGPGADLAAALANHGELFELMPIAPFENAQSVQEALAGMMKDWAAMVYVCIAKINEDGKPPTEEVAGMIGFLLADRENACVEVGFVMTLPKFQRTFVTTNAIGLILIHALDPPKEGFGVDGRGGLGLRRVQWQTSTKNIKSITAAKRFGFVQEGILRWTFVQPSGKISNGRAPPQGRESENEKGPGRDSVMLSLCWDDWEIQRQHTVSLMGKR